MFIELYDLLTKKKQYYRLYYQHLYFAMILHVVIS